MIVSDSDGRPTTSGINVRIETTQTSQSNSRSVSRDSNDMESNSAETAVPWTKAWEEQESMKQL